MARVAGRAGQGSNKARRKTGVVAAVFALVLVAGIILVPPPASPQQPAPNQIVSVARITEGHEGARTAEAEQQEEPNAAASASTEQDDEQPDAAQEAEVLPDATEQQQQQQQPAAEHHPTDDVHTGIFFTVKGADGKEQKIEVLNEPVPEDCHMELNADYAGDGLTWGLEWKLASAAQCCQACKEYKPNEHGERCDLWVWCGDPSGECWTPDFWNHTTGECWLKSQKQWDHSVDLATTNLEVNSRGPYSQEFRDYHKDSTERVPWTSGLIPP